MVRFHVNAHTVRKHKGNKRKNILADPPPFEPIVNKPPTKSSISFIDMMGGETNV